MLLIGPAGSGKTTWILHLLRSLNELVNPKPNKIIFYYNIWQPLYDYMDEFVHEFRKGIPARSEIEDLAVHRGEGGSLVIIDDQLQNVNKELAEIFMVAGRHSGVSLIFLSQSMFPRDPHFRSISLQSSYIVLMKNPRDSFSIGYLARQLKPSNSRALINIFHDATHRPFSYLLFDLRQETGEDYRFRSNIFPHENPAHAYLFK